MVIWSGLLLAVVVAGLVASEVRSFRPGVWTAKPIASSVFVATALLAGAPGSAYGRWVLVALALSWVGDVLLMSRRTGWFAAGLGSFLLAHLAFASAFLRLPQARGALALGAVGMVAVGAVVLRWLWPHLPGKLRPAVVLYVTAISVMAALAAGASPGGGSVLGIAAAAFAASDVLVARHRFVTPAAFNELVGLPLYYAAQRLLAWSTAPGGW